MKNHLRTCLSYIASCAVLCGALATHAGEARPVTDGVYRLFTEPAYQTNAAHATVPTLIEVTNGTAKVISCSTNIGLQDFTGTFSRADADTPWWLILQRGEETVSQLWQFLETGRFLVRPQPDAGLRQIAILEGVDSPASDEPFQLVAPVPPQSERLFVLTASRSNALGNFEQDIRVVTRLGQPFWAESWTGRTDVVHLSGILEEKESHGKKSFVFRGIYGFGSLSEGTTELELGGGPYRGGFVNGPQWSLAVKAFGSE